MYDHLGVVGCVLPEGVVASPCSMVVGLLVVAMPTVVSPVAATVALVGKRLPSRPVCGTSVVLGPKSSVVVGVGLVVVGCGGGGGAMVGKVGTTRSGACLL